MPQVTESDFAAIANEIAGRRHDVVSFSVTGYGVHMEISSRSGKQTWPSSVSFDPDRNWHYTWSSPYPGASTPRAVGNEIQRQVRALEASP